MPLFKIYGYVLVQGIFASYSCREYLGICAFVRTTYKYVVIRIVVFYVIIKIVLEIRDIILGNMRIGVNIGIIFFLLISRIFDNPCHCLGNIWI